MSYNEKDDVLKKGVETPTESPPSIFTGELGSSSGDEARLAQAGYEQQLDRTFSLPSLIALSLCLMAVSLLMALAEPCRNTRHSLFSFFFLPSSFTI